MEWLICRIEKASRVEFNTARFLAVCCSIKYRVSSRLPGFSG